MKNEEKDIRKKLDNLLNDNEESRLKGKLNKSMLLLELLFDIMPDTNYVKCSKACFNARKKFEKVQDFLNALIEEDDEKEIDDNDAKKFLDLFKKIDKLLYDFIEENDVDEILEEEDDEEDE